MHRLITSLSLICASFIVPLHATAIQTESLECCKNKDDNKYEFVGYHLVASYMDCDYERLTDLPALKEAMLLGIAESGATLLQTSDYVFPPDGYTCVMLLSESHASIHTYPEEKACFVDFFTCGRSCSAEKFEAVLREYLKANIAKSCKLIRDQDDPRMLNLE